MKISIVTPSFNQGQFIEQTILSVLHQDHSDVEHLVMDGGSTDETVAILSRYPHLKWVSEKDAGQSNAINKGFRKSAGGILAWLNADDYYEYNVFGEVARYFETHRDCMLLYGDITFVDRKGDRLFSYAGDTIDYHKLVACPDIVRQPSFFWRREVIEAIGSVDEGLQVVMDFDFFLRIGKRWKFHYLPRNLSYYRQYEENKSFSMRRRQVAEIYSVYRKNHVPLNGHIVKFLVGKYVKSFAAGDALVAMVRGRAR